MAARFLPMVESSKLPIRYPEFAARVRKAMAQGNWEVQGIVDGFKRAGIRITYEMVRRYSLGQAMPRQDKMGSLAQILGVSPSYLQYGLEGDVSKGQKPAPSPSGVSVLSLPTHSPGRLCRAGRRRQRRHRGHHRVANPQGSPISRKTARYQFSHWYRRRLAIGRAYDQVNC